MADPTIQQRVDRLEAAHAAHDAWFVRIQGLHEEIAREQRETERRARELREEAADERRETDRSLRELRREMGALGNKFGGFAEGMALPSMERRLRERFGTTAFGARLRRRHGSEEIEIDAVAHAEAGADGDGGIACVVEVKSHLRDEGIDQLLRALEVFPSFFPEHRGKTLIGVLACVDAPPDVRQRVLREGLVLATIHDDLFELAVPEDFEPRAFPNPAAVH